GSANPSRVVAIPLPVEKLRGQQLWFGAEVKTEAVSPKPNPWNGVKVMLVIETPGGKSYPQAEIPVGTSAWQRFSAKSDVPANATNLSLVLGLEQVTGQAWFDNARIVLREPLTPTLKVDPSRPIFRGHELSRLRGAMAGTDLREEDVQHFGRVWNGNLLRLQIIESARADRRLDEYDAWLEQRLQVVDRTLSWCEKYNVRAVVDLHSPPGGQAFSAGYVTARGRIFTQPEAQAKFVEVWKKITTRYRGRAIIWGFDLVNEPDDSMVTEDCLDWNGLADKAARAVRAIDPNRAIIVEPAQWGNPGAFESFRPLDVPNVIYSYHFYQPMHFTHQGIQGNAGGVVYPGEIDGKYWDRAALECVMQPAIDFARKYRVHMYVGEFSAIRTAPAGAAAKYLADVIDILESHGFDWSYHAYREWQGWSLEHQGPLDNPVEAQVPTDRERIVTGWFSRNSR
ncbi:MAG TPA: cellulase family glycosylhydrolase, partial [Verrucomicrobiae bacterium]|nr:cellulase family glycosylhydrolase [Verrucomicrobiae bacterium]